MMITCCGSMSDTFDRPSWYRIWSVRGKFYGRAFENPRTNPEKEKVWDAIIRINWFYKCYRGPGGCVYLLRILRAAVVTCQWMNIKRNASKISFYEMKTRKNAMYYKRSYKYYVINYYYCYDYYLQWLLHHYRIIRRLNKLPKKKDTDIHIYEVLCIVVIISCCKITL